MNNTVRTLALDPTNGLLYAGGDFTAVNGATTRNRLAAVSTTTATATVIAVQPMSCLRIAISCGPSARPRKVSRCGRGRRSGG